MVIHVDLDASKKLFVGGFLRYKDSGAVYCGSFVMEKIEDELADSQPRFFHYDGNASNEDIKPIIMDYLYSRHLNVVKIPSNIHSLLDFENWMRIKQETEGRLPPQYDLFVAAPIRGYINPKTGLEEFRNELLRSLSDITLDTNTEVQNRIQIKVDAALNKHFPFFAGNDKASKFEETRAEISQMLQELRARKVGYERIWYAPAEETFNINNKIDASTLLDSQLSRFKSSRSFMMILPDPVVSSIFLEVGWAMLTERNIPIYILCNHRKDLPFLLRKADTLKKRRIFIATFEEVGGIRGIPDWIVDNKYYKYLDVIR